MAKVVRPTYPKEFSVGLLLLIFALSMFLAGQLFDTPNHSNDDKNVYIGMFLVAAAVVIMVLVLWEEFLFPIKFKPESDGVVFRNHRTKLMTQTVIYLIIPAVFVFIYLEYDVNMVRFLIWAAVCTIAPVVGKLVSGLKNYNDFLKLTDDVIEYKNNEKTGVYPVREVQEIILVKDDRKVLHKIQLVTMNSGQVTIDLDEMELEAYYQTIDEFVKIHYKKLPVKTTIATVAA